MTLLERLRNGYAYYGPYSDAVEADANEAADEIEKLTNKLEMAEAVIAGDGALITGLKNDLAEREKQIVMLREVLEKVRGHGRLYNLFSCVGSDSYDPECADLNAQKCRELAEEALAATDDMSGYILCHAEPVGYVFQHEDTGRTMCVEAQQVEWNFEKNNPRLFNTGPLYRAWEPKP